MRPLRIPLALALSLAAACAGNGRGESTGDALPGGTCAPQECGPVPALPGWVCQDGTLGGPTGRCLRGSGGRCAWEIRECAAKLCGGIANLPCPGGFECVDDPRDDCDPRSGGADCSGFCTPSEASSSDRTR